MSATDPRARRQDLTPLLHARSLAIVGISQPGRFGGMVHQNLASFGYAGTIHGVNPRYESLYDRPCHPSLYRTYRLSSHRLISSGHLD